MKKTAAVLVAAVLALGGLAACGTDGGGSAEGGKVKTLNLWMPTLANDNHDKEMWESITKKFEEENKVKVNVTIIPWTSYETKFLTGVASGDGPDVGYMYPELLADYIKKNQLVELDKYVTPEQKANLLYLNRGTYQGKQYALPLLVGAARVIFYNKDLLAKAGVQPPTTWDEFKAAGEKLKAADITPWIAPWGDKGRGVMNSIFYPFVWQNGGRLFSEDGKKTEFDSPAVVEAAQYLKGLMDADILAKSSTGANVESSRKTFSSGKAAFIIESEAKHSLWDDAKINYGYILSLKKQNEGTFFASDQLVMFKSCKDKELCYKLMDYLTQGKQMAQFHKGAMYEPVGKDEKREVTTPFAEIYEKHADVLHTLPLVPNCSGAYNVLYKNMQAMFTGQKTPEQALKDAAKAGNEALAK